MSTNRSKKRLAAARWYLGFDGSWHAKIASNISDACAILPSGCWIYTMKPRHGNSHCKVHSQGGPQRLLDADSLELAKEGNGSPPMKTASRQPAADRQLSLPATSANADLAVILARLEALSAKVDTLIQMWGGAK